MKWLNKLGKVLVVILALLIYSWYITLNITASAEELSSSIETENNMGNITNMYREENIIFENSRVLEGWDVIELTDDLQEVDSEVELMTYDDGAISFDTNNINAIGELTAFLMVKQGKMYHGLEIYM